MERKTVSPNFGKKVSALLGCCMHSVCELANVFQQCNNKLFITMPIHLGARAETWKAYLARSQKEINTIIINYSDE